MVIASKRFRWASYVVHAEEQKMMQNWFREGKRLQNLVVGFLVWTQKKKEYLKEIIFEGMEWLRLESKVLSNKLSVFCGEVFADWLNSDQLPNVFLIDT